jgi:hypothetical protein
MPESAERAGQDKERKKEPNRERGCASTRYRLSAHAKQLDSTTATGNDPCNKLQRPNRRAREPRPQAHTTQHRRQECLKADTTKGQRAIQRHKGVPGTQSTSILARNSNKNETKSIGPTKTRKSTSHKQLQLQQATASECSDKSDTSLREKRRRNFYTVLNEAITPLTLRCARCSQGKDYKMHLQQRQDARNGT